MYAFFLWIWPSPPPHVHQCKGSSVRWERECHFPTLLGTRGHREAMRLLMASWGLGLGTRSQPGPALLRRHVALQDRGYSLAEHRQLQNTEASAQSSATRVPPKAADVHACALTPAVCGASGAANGRGCLDSRGP